jgi:hypothetical protein
MQMINMDALDRRLHQLADNISKDLKLLQEYEGALRYEDDPRKIEKYNYEIDRQRASVALYQQEYENLKKQVEGFLSRDTPKIDNQQNEINTKLKKIKILFLASNPKDTNRLELDREIRDITEKIRASKYRDSIDLVSAWAVRPDDLLQLLMEHEPQIVHFSGHGSQYEEIILVDDGGRSKTVSNKALKSLFTTLKDNIRIVVLNACFSRPQADAITEAIDCAVGMNNAIGDEAAIIFAASFYRAIGFGRSIQNAFEQGKVALQIKGIPEEITPELLVKEGVDLSQVVLINP